jgi:Fibronectin type III domain
VEKFDPENGVWLPCGKTDGSVPEMEINDLTPGHEYKFRVRAVNPEGESENLETIGHIVAKDPFSKFKIVYEILEQEIINNFFK